MEILIVAITMEMLLTTEVGETKGLVACCDCGGSIPPNPTNMCIGCVRSRVDITEGIPKQSKPFDYSFNA
jgi:hypothetical protein